MKAVNSNRRRLSQDTANGQLESDGGGTRQNAIVPRAYEAAFDLAKEGVVITNDREKASRHLIL
jgi:hypothetical protein